MGVENGAGSACVNDPEMHQRFRAGSAFPINDLSVLIDFDQLSGRHGSFVNAAWCHQQSQRLSLHHHAEVPSRAITPTSPVQQLHGRDELLSGLVHSDLLVLLCVS